MVRVLSLLHKGQLELWECLEFHYAPGHSQVRTQKVSRNTGVPSYSRSVGTSKMSFEENPC